MAGPGARRWWEPGEVSAGDGVDHSGSCRASPVENEAFVTPSWGTDVIPMLLEFAIKPCDLTSLWVEKEPTASATGDPGGF